MKIAVEITASDHRHQEWKKGEKGYVVGFVRGADDVPYSVVVINLKLVMIPLHDIKVLNLG